MAVLSEIKVWQKAIELVVDIYSCTREFSEREKCTV